MMKFDAYVAADWSGARGDTYDGVAVARCLPGDAAPKLVMPPGRQRWRRSDFVSWLVGQAEAGHRLLVGIDCNFALPEPAGRVIAGERYGVASLWDRIDTIAADQPDYYGGSFAQHADYAHLFWHAGKRPAGFAEHHRASEVACRDQGFGAPESPLKLLGARQVGNGLAGMRVLAALKARLGDDFAAWPFDAAETARIVCVEIYPRMFLRNVGHGNRKVATHAELVQCLTRLGCKPSRTLPTEFSDHQADALVAAAGMRGLADDLSVWTPPGLDALACRAEGWIFGVA